MIRPSGLTLLVGLMLLMLSLKIYRAVFADEDGPLSMSAPQAIWVELGDGFPDHVAHQFIDGSAPGDVMKLTHYELSAKLVENPFLEKPFISGQRIDLHVSGDRIDNFSLSWMTAGKRIALGISLHPDRMSEADWQVLPGIGEKTAQAIENDRQNNGDFVRLNALKRVPGIGTARVSRWNQYFFKD